MPRAAVYLTIRCLHEGCGLEETSSVGLDLADAERIETAESFIWQMARHCRTHHEEGVQARFSDRPDWRAVFSMRRTWRRLWLVPSPTRKVLGR